MLLARRSPAERSGKLTLAQVYAYMSRPATINDGREREMTGRPTTCALTSRRRTLLGVALATAALAVVNAPSSEASSKSQPSPADTKVVAVMSAGVVEVSPGLCNPGNTPWCINAPQDQVHIYSLACSGTGSFEGHKLAPGSPCRIDLTAFMDPSTGFATPNCVTTHTHTSDRATAFGKPVNAVTIGGVSRHLELSYPYAAASSRTATGWLAGPHGHHNHHHNHNGDHRLILSVQVRPRQSDPPPWCTTRPFTGGDVTGVMHITDY